MSWNIDNFRVKKIENLKIPVASLYKHGQEDLYPEIANNNDGTATVSIFDNRMYGTIDNGIFTCTNIECYGEGSGTVMGDVLEPALKDSTGEFIASCVWERGEEINRLIVKDGDISWEDIEI